MAEMWIDEDRDEAAEPDPLTETERCEARKELPVPFVLVGYGYVHQVGVGGPCPLVVDADGVLLADGTAITCSRLAESPKRPRVRTWRTVAEAAAHFDSTAVWPTEREPGEGPVHGTVVDRPVEHAS